MSIQKIKDSTVVISPFADGGLPTYTIAPTKAYDEEMQSPNYFNLCLGGAFDFNLGATGSVNWFLGPELILKGHLCKDQIDGIKEEWHSQGELYLGAKLGIGFEMGKTYARTGVYLGSSLFFAAENDLPSGFYQNEISPYFIIENGEVGAFFDLNFPLSKSVSFYTGLNVGFKHVIDTDEKDGVATQMGIGSFGSGTNSLAIGLKLGVSFAIG